MVVIIDYGMGNLRSVSKALEHVGIENKISDKHEEIAAAEALVLPGVGAFGDACDGMHQHGVFDLAKERATEAMQGGRPFLGICLGMQILVNSSEESAGYEGLGVISGHCRLMKRTTLKVPQMGWNELVLTSNPCPLYRDLAPHSSVYFVHSFEVVPDDRAVVSATVDFGGDVVASMSRGNLYAAQFHPEKSQIVGLKMLQNFSDIIKKAAV